MMGPDGRSGEVARHNPKSARRKTWASETEQPTKQAMHARPHADAAPCRDAPPGISTSRARGRHHRISSPIRGGRAQITPRAHARARAVTWPDLAPHATATVGGYAARTAAAPPGYAVFPSVAREQITRERGSQPEKAREYAHGGGGYR